MLAAALRPCRRLGAAAVAAGRHTSTATAAASNAAPAGWAATATARPVPASTPTRAWPRLVGAAAAAAAAVAAAAVTAAADASPPPPPPSPLHAVPWVRALAADPHTTRVLSAAALAETAHAVVGGDHMFSALLRHDLVTDVVAFFDAAAQEIKFVIALGDDVCGYPRIVHGGLTAAIVDEAVGHLFYALRCAHALPFRGPAFTANLSIDYRRKIAAGRVLLVTARVVECGGRKLKAVATVADGPGDGAKIYAQGTALFVAPSTSRLLREGLRYAASYVAPGWVSLDG